GTHLASYGYLVVHPQHAGSDAAGMRETFKKDREKNDEGKKDGERRAPSTPLGPIARTLEDGTSDPHNLTNRPLDITFAIYQVAPPPRLSAIADMDRVGVAGHSFGSYTSLTIAGMMVHVPTPKDPAKSFRDPRVKAAVAMSPQGPGMMGVEADGWDKIRIPVLMLTRSHDIGHAQPALT